MKNIANRIISKLKSILRRPGLLYYTYGRTKPMVDFVNKKYGDKPIKILDVGSGSYGISEYLPYRVSGLDISLPDNISNNLDFHIGSALELPFDDSSFDVVVSCDALEHIQPNDREVCISEMIRVARDYVLIACPVGNKSQKLDRILYRWGLFWGIDDWAHREHLTIPYIKENEIDEILQKKRLSWKSFRTENNIIHIFLTLVIVSPFINRIIPALIKLQPFRAFFTNLIHWSNFGRMWRKHYEITLNQN